MSTPPPDTAAGVASPYAPTHLIPTGGLAAFSTPDGRQPAVAQLDPGLDVQVLEVQGAWGHLLFSNGWRAWVDARLLVSTVAPAPATIPASAPAWQPTHLAPAEGMTTWIAPVPTSPTAERLDPGLPVAVMQWEGSWAHVACSNGWSTWVDGRLLQPHAEVSGRTPHDTADAGAAPAAAVHRGPAAALRLLVTPRRLAPGSGPLAAIGPLAAGGASLVIVGSFLPLLSLDGVSVSSWQVPAEFLVSDSPSPSGFRLGILLLLVALVALPLVLRLPLPALALLAIASPATNTGAHVVLRKLASAGYPDIGIGAVMILIGGLLISLEALRSALLARREAFT